MANLVVVEWKEERYEGIQQAVPRRCVLDSEVQVGQKVRVKLGKSAGARVWSGIYLGGVYEQQGEQCGKRAKKDSVSGRKRVKGAVKRPVATATASKEKTQAPAEV